MSDGHPHVDGGTAGRTPTGGHDDYPLDLTGHGPRDGSRHRWSRVPGDGRLGSIGSPVDVFAALVAGNPLPLKVRGLLGSTADVEMQFDALLSGAILFASPVVSIDAVGHPRELTVLGTRFGRIESAFDVGAAESVGGHPGSRTIRKRPGSTDPPHASIGRHGEPT